MMKKYLGKLAVLMAVLLLAIAGAQEYPYDQEQDVQLEQDTIVVMGSSNFDPSTSAGNYLQAVASLYESTHPGITIQLDYGAWGDLWKKVGVMLGNRQGPDLLVGPRDYLMAQGRGGGQWEDILTVPDDQFVSDIQKQAMGPALLEASRFPGRPGYMIWPWQLYIDGTMVVNGDMIRDAGFDPLDIQQNGWTMDEFLEIADSVTKDTDGDGEVDQWAAFFGPMGGHNGERIFLTGILGHRLPYRLQSLTGGGPTFIDIATGELNFDSEGWVKGCTAIRGMLDAGTIPTNTVGISIDESRAAFVNGQTAFSFDGPDLLNLVNERNRNIENGQAEGTPVEPFIVPRPYFSDDGYQPVPIRVLSYGYYTFKQEPYKGDAHTRNVFDFARFFTDPVFQVRLAYDQSPTPDARVYMGEQSWFPGILGTGPNTQYLESLREVWQPTMAIYMQMATTPELQDALRKFEAEVVATTKESVFLGRATCEASAATVQAGLDAVGQQVPQDQRLTEDAPTMAAELADFAKQIGQPE